MLTLVRDGTQYNIINEIRAFIKDLHIHKSQVLSFEPKLMN